MLDLKKELQDYPPINLEGLDQTNSAITENMYNSMILYNKALDSIKADSEDIAIIELKKSIAINPEFYEAMNLLGLCYAYTNETEKSAALFQKVIDAEKNSIQALEYMKKLNGEIPQNTVPVRSISRSGMKAGKKAIGETGKSSGFDNIGKRSQPIIKSNEKKNGYIRNIISFAAGAIIVLIISLVFMQGNGSDTPEDSISISQIDELNKKIESQNADYNKLKEDHHLLQENFDIANKNLDYSKFTIKLFEVEEMTRNNEYEKAADMLLLLKTVDFKNGEKAKFDSMFEKVMPAAANKIYEEGLVLVNTKRKYEDAIIKLNKVEKYSDEFGRMDSVLYHLGKSYQSLNDSRNAVAMYQKLIEDYPKSSYVKWATGRLNELTKIP